MSRPLTLLPIQMCQDTVEALRERLTSYCIQVCSTSLLQDEESHHWADPKPFYEVRDALGVSPAEFPPLPRKLPLKLPLIAVTVASDFISTFNLFRLV